MPPHEPDGTTTASKPSNAAITWAAMARVVARGPEQVDQAGDEERDAARARRQNGRRGGHADHLGSRKNAVQQPDSPILPVCGEGVGVLRRLRAFTGAQG